jgi:hypothetical protein
MSSVDKSDGKPKMLDCKLASSQWLGQVVLELCGDDNDDDTRARANAPEKDSCRTRGHWDKDTRTADYFRVNKQTYINEGSDIKT